MERLIVRCWNPQQAHKELTAQAWPWLKAMLMAGHRMQVEVKQETRSLAQNARLWSMLTEISQQVDWYGRKLDPESWKHIFTAALSKQDVVPGINGGFVVLGKSTSKMTKAEMAEMQELMTAFAAERGVVFAWDEVDPETGEIRMVA
jgi:hypothetical protein